MLWSCWLILSLICGWVVAAPDLTSDKPQTEAVANIGALQDCTFSAPLGMISGDIQDWQLSASSTYPQEWDKNCHERYARLYQANGRGWCARYKTPSEWLQVDLGVAAKEDTISINHNWLNAANVDISWDFMKDSLMSVEHEIEEHRATMDNWLEHCQLFLKANIGMDYVDFYNLVHVIASRRLHQLPQMADDTYSTNASSQSVDSTSTHNHLVYDLFRVEKILDEMIEPGVKDILDLGSARLLSNPVTLQADVHNAVVRACKCLGCCIRLPLAQ